MNMTTTWTFSSMAALADYFDNRAREKRARMEGMPPKSLKRAEMRGEATADESTAYMIRHTTIKEVP